MTKMPEGSSMGWPFWTATVKDDMVGVWREGARSGSRRLKVPGVLALRTETVGRHRSRDSLHCPPAPGDENDLNRASEVAPLIEPGSSGVRRLAGSQNGPSFERGPRTVSSAESRSC